MATQPQVNATQLALTPAQIMQLPPAQQQAYVNALSPQMQAIYSQEVINLGNADFMRNSREQPVFCPVTGGSGTSASFSAGTTLYFDLPQTAGFAKALLIKYNLTVTPASGSGATYSLTQVGKFGVFSRVELDYGGTQVVTHPYVTKLQDQAEGRMLGAQNIVLAGENDSSIANYLAGPAPLVVGSGNTWQGAYMLRLNPINNESPYGLLPLNGVGNQPQLKLTCNPNFYGADSFSNAICAGPSNGSGNAVTVTGTITVDCLVLDGVNMESIAPKQLQGLLGMPTMQYGWESSLTPFNANQLNTFTIKTKLEHWQLFAIVIDGQQSTSFISGYSNLTSFGLSPDATLQQYIQNIGISNNISIYDWFARRRRELGQDMDEGVIAWVNAPSRGVVDPSNRNGSQMANCYADGFPALSHAYQVGAVGTVCTPRVELFLVSKNRAGLKVGS